MCNAKNGVRCLGVLVAIAVAMSFLAGAPAAPKGKPSKELKGVRIWSEQDGKTWHFATHGKSEHPHVFAGLIDVEGAKISGATGIDKLESPDFWKIDFTKNTVRFSVRTGGKWDNINLILSRRPDTLTFDLKEDGQPMQTKRIHLGQNNKHPDGSRFTLKGD